MQNYCPNKLSIKRNRRGRRARSPHRHGGHSTDGERASLVSKRTKSRPSHSVQSRTSKSVRKSTKKGSTHHDFRNMKEWNTQGTLRQNFFRGVPNCFVDNDLLNRFTDEELPGEIKSSADYAKWLGLSERFSMQGRTYFQDHFVPYVVELLGAETVKSTHPDTSMSDVTPPVQGILPTEDPFADGEAGTAQGASETVDLGDSPNVSPYMTGIKAEQVTMSKETREKYRQLALKEADQRQLLMLLCGNVEASMFVDKQGQIRAPEQIIEHTLFLLKPYRMGNSILGEILQWMNFGVNVAWKNGFTVVCIVAQVVGILFAIDMLTKVHTMMLQGKEGPSRAFHSLIRGTANMLMWFIETQWNNFCRFIGRKCLSKPVVNRLTKRDYDKWLRVLATNGFSALCLYIVSKYKPDYDTFQQMNIAQYAVQMVKDRYHQVQAMNYLAQLTPGILGEDLSSGISIKQLNLMMEVQGHFIELDKEVDALTNDQMSGLLLKFTEAEGELTEFMVEIGNLMMSRYQTSLTSEDTEVQAFRKQLITMFPQEMRVFHFLDAYGHPRNVTDICKVFFMYWKRSQESQLIPTIPHQGGPISRWFDLTPVKFTPVKRSFATQKAKRTSSAAELMNTPNHQWWRQHAYLYKSIKNPISLEHALQENPSAEIATLTPQQLKQVKKYQGWTHRISKLSIPALVDKFQLSVNQLDDAYQQHVEVVIKGKGVKSVDWIPSREGMGYGKGTIRSAMPTPSSSKPKQTAPQAASSTTPTSASVAAPISGVQGEDIRKTLHKLQLIQHNAGGEGDCQFRALSYMHYGTNKFHASIRQSVCDELANNYTKYYEWVEGKHNTDENEWTGMDETEFKKFVKRMRRTGYWGGETTLKAAANVLNRTIHVLSDRNYKTDPYEPRNKQHELSAIYIVHVNGDHYEATEPKDGSMQAFQKIKVQPYGVLGTVKKIDGAFGDVSLLQPDTTAIVDPAGYPYITGATVEGCGGASKAIYKKISLNTFPDNIKKYFEDIKTKHKSAECQAKYYEHLVGDTKKQPYHIIHAIGPNFKDSSIHAGIAEMEAIHLLTTAYYNILKEFSKCRVRTLRLLPISSDLFSGKFKPKMAEMTNVALLEAFRSMKRKSNNKRFELCIYEGAHYKKYSERFDSTAATSADAGASADAGDSADAHYKPKAGDFFLMYRGDPKKDDETFGFFSTFKNKKGDTILWAYVLTGNIHENEINPIRDKIHNFKYIKINDSIAFDDFKKNIMVELDDDIDPKNIGFYEKEEKTISIFTLDKKDNSLKGKRKGAISIYKFQKEYE